MYLHARGMAADNPLFRAVGLMKVYITARESVIEAMKQFCPANGSIEIEAGGGPKVRLTRDKDGVVSVSEVIEKPMQQPAGALDAKTARAKADATNVNADGAEALGRQAYREDVPIINNPFPFGDARRPRWDRGWREEGGND